MGRAVGSGPATLLLPSTSHRGWCCHFPALPCLPFAPASHGRRLVPGSPGGEDGVRKQLWVWDLGVGAGGARGPHAGRSCPTWLCLRFSSSKSILMPPCTERSGGHGVSPLPAAPNLAPHPHPWTPRLPRGSGGLGRGAVLQRAPGAEHGQAAAAALTYMPTGPCGPSAPGFPGRPCQERQELSPPCSRAGSAGGLCWADPMGGSRLSTWECILGVRILLFAPLPGCQPALSNACVPPSVPAGDFGLNFMPSRGGNSSDAPALCSHPWRPPPGLSNHPNPPHISRESLRDVHHPWVPQPAPRTPTPPWALTFGPREPGSPSGPGFPWGPFIFKGNVQGGGGCNETSPTEALLVLLCSVVSGANPACPGSSHQHRRAVTMQGDKTRGVLLLGCPPNPSECPPRGLVQLQELLWLPAGCWCPPQPHGQRQGVVLRHPAPPTPTQGVGPLWSPEPCPPGGKGVPRAALPHKDHLWLGKAAESSESSRQTESLGRLSCSSLYAAVSVAKDFFFFNAF